MNRTRATSVGRHRIKLLVALLVSILLAASLMPIAPLKVADAKPGSGAPSDHVSVDAFNQWSVTGDPATATVTLFEFELGADPTQDGWGLASTYTSPDPGLSFGYSVAVGPNADRNDPIIVVGEPELNEVHLFDATGGAITLITTILAPAGAGRFGASVDTSDGLILIGDPGANAGQGSSYLYDTNGILIRELAEPAADLDAETGFVVQIESDRAWVSAPGQESGAGAVFEFEVSTGTLLTTIKADAPAIGMRFGHLLSADPARVIVGGQDLTSAFLQQGFTQTEIFSPTGNVIGDIALEGERQHRTRRVRADAGQGEQRVEIVG